MSELGDKLRDARLQKGYSIDDLQKITKIQKRYLTAIEEGAFDRLPGDFYVRAFIKQYAQSVGLDSAKLFDEYVAEIPTVQTEEPSEDVPVIKKESLLSNLKRHWPQVTILAIVILIVVFIAVAVAQTHKKNDAQIPDSGQEQVAKKPAAKKKKPAKSSNKAPDNKKAEQQKERNLKIVADQDATDQFTIENWQAEQQHTVNVTTQDADAWITVKVADTVLWQGTVTAGSSKDISVGNDVKELQIKTGNAPVTKIKINNQDLPVAEKQTGTVHNYTLKIKE
ncbi:helix-turn-helix domain-containing protein [Bombilactobacillus thymidiniphilus]|uniref:DUF4115 domain-containing protein n=1 Tax=Bombilactobacillus thymidiniphilus TaxID=2923363 RepID=A0ABY4PC09_9LACO|nr:RodZ domain-containing protein [Bombilactobacillus thymidiniphilus]UQS83300.1 DUF4115 domain-containing protein [Bombilactobacillus thymidiniphilus]